MTSSGMLRSVALVRTDVSEELSASIIRVERISEKLLISANVVPSSLILHSHRRETLRSYIALTG
jgi:hypothetical protein